jgi:hypothetical protein
MIRASRLPLIVAAIVVPTIAALFLGGVELAALVALVVLLVIVLLAVLAKPREPIEVAGDHSGPRRILLAVSQPVDDDRTADEIARAARTGSTGSGTEILVVAPTQPSFLDRWASDLRNAEREAERKLEITVASLAEKHLKTRTEIGGPELLLAIEDTLRAYPADEVILATGSADEDYAGAHAASDLRERLTVPFEHLVVGSADGHR